MRDVHASSLTGALRCVATGDAVAIPWLGDAQRQALLASTATLAYRPATPEVGPAHRRVHQDFELCYDVPAQHPLWQLAEVLGARLRASLRDLVPNESDSFELNDLVVQRYPPGCRGITAHRDHVRYRLAVAIVLLDGDGEFCVCSDRDGDGEREVNFRPGEMLLMRAPGLGHGQDRPFHLMRAVTSRRVTAGLRYDCRASRR